MINKVATAATVDGEGGGLAAYSYAYAVFIVPHSLITVSLATAMLPSASRLAHAGDLGGVAAEVGRTWRLALTALLPAAIAFSCSACRSPASCSASATGRPTPTSPGGP